LGVAPDVDHALLRGHHRFDLIFANILAEPLIELAPRLSRLMSPGGFVILSGLLNSERRAVRAAYVACGLAAQTAISLNDWAVLTLRHR
jgi:ribosomal protein L11 methyltransferase